MAIHLRWYGGMVQLTMEQYCIYLAFKKRMTHMFSRLRK